VADTPAGYDTALRPVDVVLQRPEVRARVQLSVEERELLAKRFHLSTDELVEIEAGYYRPLDACHLEECFLLRDAGRSLTQSGVPTLRQAEICLDWVCRQVLLRETAGNLIPPVYVLRQGHGSARERALVFIALLNQLHIPGCMLAWPEAVPGGARTVLAGVVAGNPEKSTLYLFDPRLGRPVSGPGGKGIATLADLRQQPALFPVSKEDAARPEVLLACPLLALAPRIRFLEKKLIVHEQVVLGIEPAKALARLEKAAGEAVGVWNPPAVADRVACNSPIRMLRFFLPVSEGGVDRGTRRERFDAELVRMSDVMRRLADLRLRGERALIVNQDAQNRLLLMAKQMFSPYGLETHAFLLHGQYEKAAKRLDMIASAYDDMDFSPLSQQAFEQELVGWCALAHQAYLAQIRKLPKGDELVARLWHEDQYLLTLMEAQEKPNPQKQKKTILTVALLTALRGSLGAEVHYLQAQNWQEQAEKAQASWQRFMAAGDAAKARKVQQRAYESWQNAAGLWRKCVERHSLDRSNLSSRLKAAHDLTERNQVQWATSVWNYLLTDLYRSAAARLNLARALEHLGNKEECLHRLTELAQLLAEARPELQQHIDEFSKRAAAAGMSKEFAESMTRDTGPQGGFATLTETVQRRLGELKGN